MTDEPEEVQVKGHKVFVFERGGFIVLEAVNDDRPLVRMTFELSSEEADEIATMLRRLADA